MLALMMQRTYAQKVQSIASANLLGLWRLNETSGTTAFDSTGARRDGVYVNSPTLGQPGIGDGGTAPLFIPASSTRVNIYSAGLASAFNGQEGTLSIWFKVRAASVLTDGTARYPWILAADGNNQIQFRRTTVNNQYTFLYDAGGTIKSFNITNTGTDWQNATMTWSKSGDAMKGYIAGAQVGTTQTGLGTYAGTLTDGNANLGAGGTGWDGYCAVAALWNTALSAPQVAALAVLT